MNDEAPQPLCTSCLEPHAEGAHFCPSCGCPVSSFATVGPIEHIHAIGWAARRVLQRRIPGWLVLGLWATMGPHAAIGAYGLIAERLREGLFLADLPFMFVASLLGVGLQGAILLRFTVAYVSQGPRQTELSK